jgi:hypothetical protein
MAVITISVVDVGPELISGVPQWVSLSTNIPATIFYTLDGSVPTIASSVYITSILLTTTSSIRLRALAISGVDLGILDVFFASTTYLTYPRRIDATYGAGIVVDAALIEDVFDDGYGLDESNVSSEPIRYYDVDVPRLDIQLFRDSSSGEGTMLSVGFAPPKNQISFDMSTPNGNNVFFNPKSLYVVIDGRDGYEDQVHDGYLIINRPCAGTMDPVNYLGGKMFYEPHPYTSGGFVKTHYDSRNKVSVSYYFDANETRWIKSIENFDPTQVPANLGLRHSSGGPLVFKWVYNKRSVI